MPSQSAAASSTPVVGTTPPAPSQATSAVPMVKLRQRENAERNYLSGARHLRDGEFAAAEQDFGRAAVLDPARPEYVQALALAREHRVTDLLQQAAQQRPLNPAAADRLIDQARQLDANNPRVLQHGPPAGSVQDAMFAPPPPQARATRAAGAVTLQPNATRHSYHERSDLRTLVSKLASDYGLRATLDPELQTGEFRIDVDDVGFADATRVFAIATGTFFVPLDEKTFIVAKDTGPNRQRFERMVEQTFYLPGFTADQMKDFVSIAQQVLTIKQVSVEPTLNSLVMRGPADEVDAAASIIADLLGGGSDVVLDLKLYEVNKQRVRNLGVQLPQSFNVFSLASEAQSIVSANSSLITQLISSGVIPSTANVYQLAAYLVFVAGVGGSSSALTNSFLIFGGGASTGVLSAGSIPMLNLALTESDARSLDDVQLRASNLQNITFKSGTRYPIQTSLFSDIATSATGSNLTVNGVSLTSLLSQYLGTSSIGSSATIPQVQYEDLGLVVTATPHILRTSNVGMHFEVKVTSLSGTALNGIPILGSRQFTADLTLHDGETAMMISNTTESETKAVTGLPGLSEIPGFQSTTNDNSTKITGDLVMLVTPHIVRLGHTRAVGPYLPLQRRPDEE